jgi:putative transposon-encoded protein
MGESGGAFLFINVDYRFILASTLATSFPGRVGQLGFSPEISVLEVYVGKYLLDLP